jgi:hypothetical protein
MLLARSPPLTPSSTLMRGGGSGVTPVQSGAIVTILMCVHSSGEPPSEGNVDYRGPENNATSEGGRRDGTLTEQAGNSVPTVSGGALPVPESAEVCQVLRVSCACCATAVRESQRHRQAVFFLSRIVTCAPCVVQQEQRQVPTEALHPSTEVKADNTSAGDTTSSNEASDVTPTEQAGSTAPGVAGGDLPVPESAEGHQV